MESAMNPLIFLAAVIAAVALVASLSRPAPQQYIVVPIEPAQARGFGCGPLLLVVLAVVLLIIVLTPS
jgi:hypothetical protein